MEFFKVIKKRQTVRKFKKKEIPQTKLNKIIDAARIAPSAMNEQSWHFVVVKNKKSRKKIRQWYDEAREKFGGYKQDTSFVENGTIVLPFYEKKACAPEVSAALATENLILAATALGLQCVYMVAPLWHKPNIGRLKKITNIPKKYEPLCVVIVGYPEGKHKKKPKKKLSEIMSVDKFKGKKD
ncbi:nitroreductase family protein [Nanoarchaeota archaeon]